jgi:adenylate kinase
MFRANIAKATPMGLAAKKFMDEGQLVPDEVVVGMIRDRIEDPDCAQGFIFDGFPRTIPQAEALDKMLSAKKLTVNRVVEFQIDDSELVGRLSGRRTCTKCGAMYHVTTMPTKVAGVCDKCGGAVVQRDDDKEAVIQKRLKVYRDQTSPLVAYYTDQGKLRSLDASRPMDQVFADLQAAITSH